MISPDDIDPKAIHMKGTFGQFEMEVGAAVIVAYAQDHCSRGPFTVGALADFGHGRRGLDWENPRHLPGWPEDVEKDLGELARREWIKIAGRVVMVDESFWTRCLEKAHRNEKGI